MIKLILLLTFVSCSSGDFQSNSGSTSPQTKANSEDVNVVIEGDDKIPQLQIAAKQQWGLAK